VTSHAPMFIVGAGRSGTTLLYELLCGHPSLAWISNVSERFPGRASAAAVNRLARLGPSPERRLALRPTEGYPAFDWASPEFVGGDSPPLTAKDLTPTARHRLHEVAERHVRGMRRERFLNKNTRNTRRIPYLAAAFPEARFVHVIRHPYAVVASLLRVDFWRDITPWPDSTPSAPEARAADQTTLAARLWREEVSIARRSARPSHYLEIRYEAMVIDPAATLDAVLGFAQLDRSRRFDQHRSRFQVRDRSRRGHERLAPDQRATIAELARPLAQELQYDL
jgi:hypothetical protein